MLIIFCHSYFVYFMFIVCSFLLVVNYWERADLLALLYVMFIVFLSLSHLVSWVRCDAGLSRF